MLLFPTKFVFDQDTGKCNLGFFSGRQESCPVKNNFFDIRLSKSPMFYHYYCNCDCLQFVKYSWEQKKWDINITVLTFNVLNDPYLFLTLL
jgi:hypothetical protein